MKYAALLLLLCSPSWGATLTWNNAVQNTDTTPIPASGPGSLTETRIHYSQCVGGDVDTNPPVLVVAASVTTTEIPTPVGEEWCFRATHVNTYGNESDVSNLAVFTEPAPVPNPPQNLTVDPANLVAYGLSQTADRLVIFPVGTVPQGTPCDSTMSANGHYLIPRDAVSYAGSVRPAVVVAQCGSGG